MASADTPEEDPARLKSESDSKLNSDCCLTGALTADNGIQSILCDRGKSLAS